MNLEVAPECSNETNPQYQYLRRIQLSLTAPLLTSEYPILFFPVASLKHADLLA